MDDDEALRSLRRARPADGWSRSPAGQAVLERTLRPTHQAVAAESPVWRRTGARVLAATAACGALVLALYASGTLSPGVDQPPEATGRVVVMDGGYALDVTRLPVVLAYAGTAFVGRVEQVKGQDEDGGWTYARVAVTQSIVGSVPDTVTIRQSGYVDESGTTHLTEDQPLVVAGRDYVFAASAEPDSETYTVVAGPHGAVDPGADLDALIRTYRDAASG